jgi:hypothetical protein
VRFSGIALSETCGLAIPSVWELLARAFRFATNVAMTAFEELGQAVDNGSTAAVSPNTSSKPKMT